MNSSAGALLLVLVVCGVISVLVLQAWFVIGFEHDAALQRVEWAKRFYSADAILNIGIKNVCERFDFYKTAVRIAPEILDCSQILNRDFNEALPLIKSVVIIKQGQIMKKQDTLLLRAECLANNVCISSASCLISRKDKQFVVSHFTIGSRF